MSLKSIIDSTTYLGSCHYLFQKCGVGSLLLEYSHFIVTDKMKEEASAGKVFPPYVAEDAALENMGYRPGMSAS